MTISNRQRNLLYSSNIAVEETKSLTEIYEENPTLKYAVSDYECLESMNIKIHVHMCDIAEMAVDAIVCSTQTQLVLEPIGLCKHIWSKGGPGLQKACIDIEYCPAGDAFPTDGFDLPAKFVLHTAGPPPHSQLSYNERKQSLRQSYLSCLQLIRNTPDIKTVAFPCLGSGGAGIELTEAIRTGITAIRAWLEDVDNKLSVEHIVLCMYDEDQWNQYFPELIKVFPYGKDFAGLDLEQLDPVTISTLALPSFVQTTNILCYQYKPAACTTITKHFHKLANMCFTSLGTPDKPLTRYRNCVIFEARDIDHHQLTLYHSTASNTVEIQIVSFCPLSQTVDADICKRVQSEIKDYFDTNTENVTSFKTYTRCKMTSWGDTEGLLSIHRLLALASKPQTKQALCKHVCQKDTHVIDISTMLKYWTNQHSDSIESSESSGSSGGSLPGCFRLPVEHIQPESDLSQPITSDQETAIAVSQLQPVVSQPKPTILRSQEPVENTWPLSRSEPNSLTSHTIAQDLTQLKQTESNTNNAGASWNPFSDFLGNLVGHGLQRFTKSAKSGQECDERVCTNDFPFNDLKSLSNQGIFSDNEESATNLVAAGLHESSLTCEKMSSRNISVTNMGETSEPENKTKVKQRKKYSPQNLQTSGNEELINDSSYNLDIASLRDTDPHEGKSCSASGRENIGNGAKAETMEADPMSVHCDPSLDDDAGHSLGDSYQHFCQNCSRNNGIGTHTNRKKESKTFNRNYASQRLDISEKDSDVRSGHMANYARVNDCSSSCSCEDIFKSYSGHSQKSRKFDCCGSLDLGGDIVRDFQDKINDKDLLTLAKHIGNKQSQLGIELGLEWSCVQRIIADKPGDSLMQGFDVLRTWWCRRPTTASLSQLIEVMHQCDIDTSLLKKQFNIPIP